MADQKVKKEDPNVQPEDAMPDIPQASAGEPVEDLPEGLAPNIQTSQAPQTNEAQPVAPAPSEPSAETPVPEENIAEKTPQQEAQDRFQHDMQFADDLRYGKVQPKTYHDLYAAKDLPGKIGTIFGLMLSGAGSAVAGQPNMLMEMMNKEIERDFEAQKSNQQNKQNWYHLSLQHELQDPDVARKWSEAQKAGFINQQMGITDNSATASGLNRQTAGILNDLQNNINMLPPGPNKDAAQAKFNNETIPFFMQKAAIRQQGAASKNAVIKAAIPKPQAAREPSSQDFINSTVNTNEYQNRLKRGKATVLGGGVIDPKTMIDPSDDKVLQDAITHSKVNRANYKDVMDAAQQLADMPNAGEAPIGKAENALNKVPWVGPLLAAGMHFGQGKLERPRDQLLNALGQRLAGRGASGDTIQEIKEALSPSMFDSPQTMKKLEELNYQHFAHNDAEQNGIFDKYQGIKNPLPRIKLKVNMKKESKGEKAVDNTGDFLNNAAKSMGLTP